VLAIAFAFDCHLHVAVNNVDQLFIFIQMHCILHIFQTILTGMVLNAAKPLDGLKVLLYHLFTPEEVRVSSLKGVTTAAGGETVGLNRN